MEAISDFIETVVWVQEGIVNMRGTWRRRGPHLPTVPICAGVPLFLTSSHTVLLIGHFSCWSHSLIVIQIKWVFVSFWVGYVSWAHANHLVLSVSLRMFKPSAASCPTKKKKVTHTPSQNVCTWQCLCLLYYTFTFSPYFSQSYWPQRCLSDEKRSTWHPFISCHFYEWQLVAIRGSGILYVLYVTQMGIFNKNKS